MSEFETWYDVAFIAIGLDFFDVAMVVPGVPPPPFQICTGLTGRVEGIGDIPVLIVDILLYHAIDRRSVLQIGPSANPLDYWLDAPFFGSLFGERDGVLSNHTVLRDETIPHCNQISKVKVGKTDSWMLTLDSSVAIANTVCRPKMMHTYRDPKKKSSRPLIVIGLAV
jgi:hypothetical protein